MATMTAEEQAALREAVRDFLDQADGEDVWSRLASDLALLGIAVPEEHGGAGASVADQLPVLVELGRSLTPVPYLASAVLATTALQHAGDAEAVKRLLPAAVAGERVLTLAVAEGDLAWSADAIAARATEDGSQWTITGRKANVLEAGRADDLLVVAATSEGIGLFHVEARAPGVRIAARAPLDPTRPCADVVLTEAPARPVGSAGRAGSASAWAAVEQARDVGLVALTAEALGGVERLCELTVAHATSRFQFGVPIGSFQAVKHHVANMVVGHRALAGAAGIAARVLESPAELTLGAATMAAYCADAYVRVAEIAIQVHGGIGFTEEHPAHRYLKRARVNRALLGLPAHHRGRAVAGLLPA